VKTIRLILGAPLYFVAEPFHHFSHLTHLAYQVFDPRSNAIDFFITEALPVLLTDALDLCPSLMRYILLDVISFYHYNLVTKLQQQVAEPILLAGISCFIVFGDCGLQLPNFYPALVGVLNDVVVVEG
jgi:hypothetical protein